MSQDVWSAVDHYIQSALVPTDPVLEAALANNAASDLPAIDVSPTQGKLLYLLGLTCGAKKILEIGTLGGYSTTWLARSLPTDGRLLTLELEAKHAAVARQNLDNAGVGDLVEIRVGPAIESLKAIDELFDLIFIDADKASIPYYLPEALRLSHSGTVILIDNVVRNGDVVNADHQDDNVKGVQRMFEMLAEENAIEATAIQTVGSKGYDGLAIIRVR